METGATPVLHWEQLTLGFETQLAAFFTAKRGNDVLSFQSREKGFANVFGGTLPGQTFDPVVRNQIHLGKKFFGEHGQRFGLRAYWSSGRHYHRTKKISAKD